MKERSELNIHRTMRLLFVILCVRLFPRAGRLAVDLLPEGSDHALSLLVLYGVPLVITLAVIMLLSRSVSLRDIGCNLNHLRWSLGAAGIGAVTAAAFAFMWVYFSSVNYLLEPAAAAVQLTLRPISQEVLYRVLVIGMLYPVFSAMRPLFGKGISAAGLISALIFALSTVAISVDPFSVSLGDPLLQIFLLALGVGYALMFEYTHSLLAPVITHAAFQGALMLASLVLPV